MLGRKRCNRSVLVGRTKAVLRVAERAPWALGIAAFESCGELCVALLRFV